jgi:hypothetical protein
MISGRTINTRAYDWGGNPPCSYSFFPFLKNTTTEKIHQFNKYVR